MEPIRSYDELAERLDRLAAEIEASNDWMLADMPILESLRSGALRLVRAIEPVLEDLGSR